MLSNFKRNIESHFPFLLGKKVLVACSGGLDSVVLTQLMHALNFEMAVAHCNFSLRGKESDGDEIFVIELAKKMAIPVFTETFDTAQFAAAHGLSVQMAARELRYTWFAQILNDFNFDYLLTAHHADDDLETFFINLSRGTGLKGLVGIPQINGNTVRPLLNFSRQEILQHAQKSQLKWREDSTNEKGDYLRNSLRLEVLPKFKKHTDSLLKNFKSTKRNLSQTQHLLEDYMAIVFKMVVTETPNSYKIDVQKIKSLPHTEALLYELLHGFGFTEWNDVLGLLDAQTGKKLLSKTHQLLKNRNFLELSKLKQEAPFEEFIVSREGLQFPINLKIESAKYIGETEKNTIFTDAKTLKFPLKLRRWKEGDCFQPFGMTGKKKISKFFKDEKFSINEKSEVWLLLSQGEIVWVVGHRMDDRFKVGANTEQILKFSVAPDPT